MTCSIVVPTYNSGACIAATIDSIISALKDKNFDFELIIVNDGSKDNTLNILKEKAALNSKIKIITNNRNYGQHRSTFTGMIELKGDYIITIDDDLEYDPVDILKLYNFAIKNDFELVYGVPTGIKQHGWKKILYSIYLSALKSSDQKRKTSFRIIGQPTVRQLMKYNESQPFVLDFFLNRITTNIGYQQVNYHPNSSSRYSAFAYLKLLFNIACLKYSK